MSAAPNRRPFDAGRAAYLTLLNLAVKDALWGHANRDIAQVRALARSLSRDG